MVREIKFRQAVFSVGSFSGWHYWGFIDGNFVCPVSEIDGMRLLPETAHKNSYQFTGLKDKNGKEIYEGDIIKARELGSKSYFHPIIWGAVEYDTQNCQFTTQMPFHNLEDLEIVGNIYESPELLK